MNLWLVIPGVVLIVATTVPALFLERSNDNADTWPIRSVLAVIGLLAGIALLFEGLLGFTAG
mgnify:CR=1 FL=1